MEKFVVGANLDFWARCSMQHEYQLSRVKIIRNDTKHTFYLLFAYHVGISMNGCSPTINHPKKNTTMVEPFARPSGMAMVLLAAPPWQPLHNELVKLAYK
jgi:hypothetical protein